jgi:hypothetical protein
MFVYEARVKRQYGQRGRDCHGIVDPGEVEKGDANDELD